jgi:uncharacterized membrane protein YdbT with pleckstrin-like domain
MQGFAIDSAIYYVTAELNTSFWTDENEFTITSGVLSKPET